MLILFEVSKMKHLGSLDCEPALENLILIGSNNVHISKSETFSNSGTNGSPMDPSQCHLLLFVK